MSERILTLFGEEIVPEQLNAVGKSRAKKKAEEKKPDTTKDKKAEPESGEAVRSEPPIAAQQTSETTPTEPQTPEPPELVAGQSAVAPEPENKTAVNDDWQGDKKYYSIGEVAEMFKVKTSHIRFWTNEFKLKVRTTRKGDRLFSPEQVKELRTIHHLVKERGFTLNGAKAKLKSPNNKDVETIDLKQSLLQLRNKLVSIRNQIPPVPKVEKKLKVQE